MNPDGVRVLSRHETKTDPKPESCMLDKEPFLCPFKNLFNQTNCREKELIMTNQEGKLFYATCVEYFIDLAQLEREFNIKGQLPSNTRNKEINLIIK